MSCSAMILELLYLAVDLSSSISRMLLLLHCVSFPIPSLPCMVAYSRRFHLCCIMEGDDVLICMYYPTRNPWGLSSFPCSYHSLSPRPASCSPSCQLQGILSWLPVR